VSGDTFSNECPRGSVRIETAVACRTAATAVGKTPAQNFAGNWNNVPRGCFTDIRNIYASFNSHSVGAGYSVTRLLCAAVTAGAPPPPHVGWSVSPTSRNKNTHYK
jgi:hypothetical protein